MSHPYWPQAMYGFRRQKAAPVPDAYGNYEGFGAESMMAPTRTYGSMSPKTDWATPRYIRAEPSGMGDFGADGCAGGLKDAIASYLANQLKQRAGYSSSCPNVWDDAAKWGVCNAKKAALDGAQGIISSAIGAALSGISGDLSDAGVRDQVHNAIASRLPGISIIGLDFDVSGALLSLVDSAIDAGISACGSALGASAGATTQLQQWCEKGYAFDKDGNAYPPEAGFPSGAELATQCAGWGYPYSGSQLVLTMMDPVNLAPAKMAAPLVSSFPLTTASTDIAAMLAAKGMMLQKIVGGPTSQQAYYVPTAAGGSSSMLLLAAGAAALAFLFLKK